jgi:hypothetical protein
LIGFAISLIIIGVVVKKVGEPILSRQINDPYTEKLTNYALNELVFPPTQQELINWTKKLESEGHIDHSYDVTLHYIQISGESDGVLYVSYYRQYLDIFQLSSKYVADVSLGRTFKDDISIYSVNSVEPQGEEYALNRNADSVSKQVNHKNVSQNERDIKENMHEDSDINGASDNLEEQNSNTNPEFFNDSIDDFETDLNEFVVFVNGIRKGDFASKEDAIAFAHDFRRAEVYVPNTIVWDNIPVRLFVNDTFIQSYDSKTEALQDAVEFDYAKLMDEDTRKVVWDNYPGRECGTCDSVIQDQY